MGNVILSTINNKIIYTDEKTRSVIIFSSQFSQLVARPTFQIVEALARDYSPELPPRRFLREKETVYRLVLPESGSEVVQIEQNRSGEIQRVVLTTFFPQHYDNRGASSNDWLVIAQTELRLEEIRGRPVWHLWMLGGNPDYEPHKREEAEQQWLNRLRSSSDLVGQNIRTIAHGEKVGGFSAEELTAPTWFAQSLRELCAGEGERPGALRKNMNIVQDGGRLDTDKDLLRFAARVAFHTAQALLLKRPDAPKV